MPGLSFIADCREQLPRSGFDTLSSLNRLVTDQQYQTNTLLESSHYFLGLRSYNAYPVTSLENADYHIFIEGKIYGMHLSRVSQELFQLAGFLSEMPEKAADICAKWLLGTDGDFLVFLLDKKTRKSWVMNDVLGRLPAYYDVRENSLVISREIRFITGLRKNVKFDRMGVAQYLLFGYPLGVRTLVEQSHRLLPATLVSIDPHEDKISLKRVYNFNFDDKPHETVPLKESATNLIPLFSDACKGRAVLGCENSGNNIVSLSGGLDSRSVAACLAVNQISFATVTRLDSAKTSWTDAHVAEILARTLGVDWSSFNVEAPSQGDLLKLLRLKAGMNPLGMVSRLSFLAQLQSVYGTSITYMTGDGGDKVLHDLRPVRTVKTMDDLLRYTVSENSIFTLEQVTKMTGISTDHLKNDIEAHLIAYPETELSQKYIHFLVFERAFKWLFEGEDRNRCYFWSVAPFYSIPFFRYAMGCSDSQKKHYRLYRAFLTTLSPSVASVSNANWGIPISSKRSVLRSMFKSTAAQLLPAKIKQLRSAPNEKVSDIYFECVAQQLRRSPAIKEYMPYVTVEELRNCIGGSRASILLSVTAAIEELSTGRSSLSCYSDSLL
jgi:asparagine synthase (glutamine-hydrolysing)